MQKVINLFAGPGAGKSTTATGVFSLLKLHGINCEYVPEVAKDLAWEGRLDDATFWDLFPEQVRRMERLRDKVEFIITDSPLLLQCVYSESELNREVTHNEFSKWDNINYFIKRVKPFNPKGRNHSESESQMLDYKIEALLNMSYYNFDTILGNYHGINYITWKTLESINQNILMSIDGKEN